MWMKTFVKTFLLLFANFILVGGHEGVTKYLYLNKNKIWFKMFSSRFSIIGPNKKEIVLNSFLINLYFSLFLDVFSCAKAVSRYPKF